MDIFLTIIAIFLLLIGVAGCIIPILPGPPISYVGLLFFHWTSYSDFSSNFLLTWLVIVVLVTLLDYFLPIWMTHRFGGSRYATIGATLGLIVGLFFGPIGILLAPFIGALIGQLITNSDDISGALKVAFGSFTAFIFGTGAKLVASIMMTYYVIAELFG